VSYLPVVLDKANTAGIPVFGSEVEQVKNGCAASEGLDYVSLGRQTGILAARVLQGEDAGVIPFEQIVESRLYVNQAVLDRFGITMTQEDIDRAEFVSND
ncbi:MAG: ABC transporter substrate-binding protein, partial [Clostridia bacterium]|nr:ABC transporter substrate-binding protein [Clostridia bacterium]